MRLSAGDVRSRLVFVCGGGQDARAARTDHTYRVIVCSGTLRASPLHRRSSS
jgi:hypothetical protein